jgi:osmoprotectant transport system substrate-binding protein
MARLCALLAVLMLAFGAAGCGSGGGGGSGDPPKATATGPGAGKPPVTLGTKNFTEQFILGQLYAQALRAKGWTVELKENIGSTEVADKALDSGGIDLYPEYTGTSLSVVKGDKMHPASAAETYAAAKAFYESRGQTLLEATPFEDRDAIAVTKRFAKAHSLQSMDDLNTLTGSVRIGGAPEFRTRFAGLEGLRLKYGLGTMRFVALEIDAGANYTALDKGRVDAADVFTTDPQLASGRYVVLKDPKAIFGFQNLAPVVNRKVLQRQGRGFAETLDAVSGKLTNAAMQQMNAAVALKHQDPAAVAHAFLSKYALL